MPGQLTEGMVQNKFIHFKPFAIYAKKYCFARKNLPRELSGRLVDSFKCIIFYEG